MESRIGLVLILSLFTAACGARVIHGLESVPAEYQLKLAKLRRVWVAGFATGKKPEFDLNLETVRLIRTQLRTWSSAQVIQAEPLTIDTEQRLSDVAYWQRLGEEHGRPLIVTGTVKLLLAPPQVVQRGIRTIYLPLAGRTLDATVVIIDGGSGQVLSTRKLPSRMRYGVGRLSSGLSLYFQMMDQAMPDWFGAITGTTPISRSQLLADGK
jgi:hypothetical protein